MYWSSIPVAPRNAKARVGPAANTSRRSQLRPMPLEALQWNAQCPTSIYLQLRPQSIIVGWRRRTPAKAARKCSDKEIVLCRRPRYATSAQGSPGVATSLSRGTCNDTEARI
jgi:hypothetical protein